MMKAIVEKRIGEYIKKSGLSEETVAKEIGVTADTIKRYKSGAPIPFTKYAKLWKVLKLDEIVYNEEYESALVEAYLALRAVIKKVGIA